MVPCVTLTTENVYGGVPPVAVTVPLTGVFWQVLMDFVSYNRRLINIETNRGSITQTAKCISPLIGSLPARYN